MFHPISNKEISKTLELCSKILELLDENEFKIKSYSIAAFKINKHPIQFYTLSPEELSASDILSKSILPKITEILTTGKLSYLEELAAQVPEGLLDLLQIKGLGAKKIKLLHQELGIQSIGELLYACQENRLTHLKGFGEKTQNQIIQNIQFIQSNNNKYLYAEVEAIWNTISSILSNTHPNYEFILAGEFIRQEAVISALDVFTDCPFSAVKETIKTSLQETELLVDEDNNSLKIPHCPLIRIHLLDEQSGKKIALLNSSEAFAQQFQSTLSDAGKYEIDFFKHNNLSYSHPAQRELYNEHPKELLEEFPIKGLIHCHSTWSDGVHSIEQMARAAMERGMEYMVISDHSESAFYANGLTPDRILLQHEEIEKLNEKLAPFKIFKSIEADILYSGEIDYKEEIWKSFDIIIASVHSQLRMTQEKATERILTAMENPYVKILGHPTGRLLLSREGYPLDYDAIFEKCKEKNIVIELNAHPRRLDLDCALINTALSFNITLSINSDAHSTDGIDVLRYGILSAQKTAMTQKDNLSSFSKTEFETFMKLTH